MNWKEATKLQLFVIAYADDYATIPDRLQAAEELKRRAREKHRRTNFRGKEVYPK